MKNVSEMTTKPQEYNNMINVSISFKNEVWSEVEGFPAYSVSDHGRFKSKYGHLKTANKNSYKKVSLSNGVKKTEILLHRLVLQTFKGQPPTPEHRCAHNDGSRDNNHVSNLRWATNSENQMDRFIHGTYTSPLTEAGVLYILQSKEKTRCIAEKIGVSYDVVRNVRNGKTWKHFRPEIKRRNSPSAPASGPRFAARAAAYPLTPAAAATLTDPVSTVGVALFSAGRLA